MVRGDMLLMVALGGILTPSAVSADGSEQGLLPNLDFLKYFKDDMSKLWAVGIIVVGGVVIMLGKDYLKTRQLDRADVRDHERRMRAFDDLAEAEKHRRKEGNLL